MEQEKIGFFKKALISIKDFEKYDMFALESFKDSIKYLFTLILIFSIIATLVYSIKVVNGGLEEIVSKVQNELNENLGINVKEMQEAVKQNYEVFFLIVFFSVLTAYFTTTFIDAAMLGLLGLIVARLIGIRMKYKAAINIGIHALTLPLILQIIYLTVNILTGFEIKYFQWMYTTISYIYVVVAILMIKTQFINQQIELMKIKLEQEKVREEVSQPEEPKSEEPEEKQENPENEEKKEEDNNLGAEPEGTNA